MLKYRETQFKFETQDGAPVFVIFKPRAYSGYQVFVWDFENDYDDEQCQFVWNEGAMQPFQELAAQYASDFLKTKTALRLEAARKGGK